MGLYFISWCLSLLVSTILGIVILVRSARTKAQKLWAVFCFLLSFVSLGFVGAFASQLESHAVFFIKMINVSAIYLPAVFFDFVVSFWALYHDKPFYKKASATFYFLSTCFALAVAFSNYVILGAELKQGLGYWLIAGPLYLPLMVYFTIPFSWGYLLLFRYHAGSSGLQRLQAKYFFIATFIGVIGGLTTFLPAFVASLYPFGIFFIPTYCLIISYAIIRHRLMDIEVIIKKTIVFAGIVAATACVISIPAGLIQLVLGKTIGIPPFWLMVSGIVTAVLVYRPLEKRLVILTDRFLFQKKFNYHKLLKENSKQLSLIKSMDEMAKQVVAFLIKQGRIRNAGIFIQSPDQKHFELKYPLGYGGRRKRPSLSMENDHPLVKLLADRKAPLVFEKLKKEAKDIPPHFSVFEDVLKVMKRLKAEVIIPSFLGTPPNTQVKNNDGGLQLRNLLVLGHKKSDEEYTDEDLDVFFTIAQDSAIAAENARLFDLMLKERESRLKAESEARLATYGKSTVHESKNALSGLYGPAQFMTIYGYEDFKKIYERYLKEKLPPPVEKKLLELLETMKQKGELIFTKADELLIIAKTGEGTLSSDEKLFEKFNLKMVWDAAKAEAKTGRCKLIRYVPDHFYPYGNVILIKRVFINLMNNAAEAMKYAESGEIILRARYDEIDGKNTALFEFSDNGPGIPSEGLDKIWEFGWSTKPKPQSSDIEASGRGQGLWRAKDTVENIHGGKIWAESELGKGTTFKFRLPLPPKIEEEIEKGF